MAKSKSYPYLIYFPVIFAIIFLYFFKWQTQTIYGDDLIEFKKIYHTVGLKPAFSLATDVGKFRPVHGLLTKAIILLFGKNLAYYYCFNAFIQTINTCLLAVILNFFFRSAIISVALSLVYGLSRFSFYNFSELFNGGALEGLAITFFLSSILFIIKALLQESSSAQFRSFAWVLFFANMDIYVHERYIVLFPVIMLAVTLFPGIAMQVSQRVWLVLMAVLSMALNVAVKKYAYGLPFFVGTGNTNISFSFSSAAGYFKDAILSIFQINSGPGYLVGEEFSGLPAIKKVVVLFLVASLVVLLAGYCVRTRQGFRENKADAKKSFFLFLLLGVVFVSCLIPAVVTIRLEQRWLQASFAVLIIMLAIVITRLWYDDNRRKKFVALLFMLLFLLANHFYLLHIADFIYLRQAERQAAIFKRAIYAGVIRPGTSQIYVWEKHNDKNENDGMIWALGAGYFFEFYQGKSKEIRFADSVYSNGAPYETSFPGFNKDSVQIVYIGNEITDITQQYLDDSLKTFRY